MQMSLGVDLHTCTYSVGDPGFPHDRDALSLPSFAAIIPLWTANQRRASGEF